MTEKQIKLAIGSMLHDIGKVVYRSGDGRNHSQSGYDYLKREVGIKDDDILNCVRFHHGAYLKSASIGSDGLAYITYHADNIAAAVDRRERDDGEDGFDKKVPLESVFNILNGNNGHSHYARQVLDPRKGVIYPTEEKIEMDDRFYKTVIQNITDNLKGIVYSEDYLDSLLSILEANLSYVPSSTSKREVADISLFDHLKITAAVALCIERYLDSKGADDYKQILFERAEKTYEEEMFLLYSMDISGIQDFIYTISTKHALRGLRARSFYLEILMEHMIDELLVKLSLCRTNLLYCGGGHCYLLLPNTKDACQVLEEQEKMVNKWFLDTFGITLYVAGGCVSCNAKNLQNKPKGSYPALYRAIAKMISGKKAHRYDAEEICYLNTIDHKGEKECLICHKMDKVNEDDRCPICASLEDMSSSILYRDFFTVTDKPEKGALPLPGDRYLTADTEQRLLERMKMASYVRSYTKNDIYTGKHVTTKLWVGDYTTSDTFEGFAEKAKGIERIGVLRADVDNLGTAFIYGFQRPDGDERYMTLSRTSVFSRQLSMFFKGYINGLLARGSSKAFSDGGKRDIAIVYSGGDDVFLVGAWNEVIDAFIDLHMALERFAQGTLTISGGVGIYPPSYPINIMAREVAELEESSKNNKEQGEKNAITLFDRDHTYGWKRFIDHVTGEKFMELKRFFDASEERGKAFLYHLLELLRDEEEEINTARYVYLLSRMEPDKDSKKEEKEAYRQFSRKMYGWRKDPQMRQEVITAMYLYVYLTRDKEEHQ